MPRWAVVFLTIVIPTNGQPAKVDHASTYELGATGGNNPNPPILLELEGKKRKNKKAL